MSLLIKLRVVYGNVNAADPTHTLMFVYTADNTFLMSI